jgi:hypothetical protein
MKRSNSEEKINETLKKVKFMKTEMLEDLDKLVPGCSNEILSSKFTIAAISESGTGKSGFLSSLLNDLIGFDEDHAELFPTKNQATFSSCTKVPIMVSYSKKWVLKRVFANHEIVELTNDWWMHEEAFLHFRKTLLFWNNLESPTPYYLFVSGPFGTMPENLSLIDMPVIFEKSNPIFGIPVNAVITFARGPLSASHMMFMFNSLKANAFPPMTIFVHDLTPDIDIPTSIAALTALMPDRYNDVDLLPQTRGNVLLRTHDFMKMQQSFTLVHRNRPWNAHPNRIDGWIIDLNLKASVHLIEDGFRLFRSMKDTENMKDIEFDKAFSPTPLKWDFLKPDFERAVEKLCMMQRDGIPAFINTLKTLATSYAATCLYHFVLQWAEGNTTHSQLFDEITRTLVLDGMRYCWPGLKNEIPVLDIQHLIETYARSNDNVPWSKKVLLVELKDIFIPACDEVSKKVRNITMPMVIRIVAHDANLFYSQPTSRISSLETEKQAFFEKYFNNKCLKFKVLPKIE